MIEILSAFFDICAYPLLHINIEDSFLGVLCYFLIFWFCWDFFICTLDMLMDFGGFCE